MLLNGVQRSLIIITGVCDGLNLRIEAQRGANSSPTRALEKLEVAPLSSKEEKQAFIELRFAQRVHASSRPVSNFLAPPSSVSTPIRSNPLSGREPRR